MTGQTPQILLAKKTAAARCGVSVRTLERLIDRGDGPPVTRLGGRVLIPETGLAAWIAANTRQHRQAA